MNLFTKANDAALGFDTSSFFDVENQNTNPFTDVFDEAYEDSIIMPYDDIISSFLTRRSMEPFGLMEEEEEEIGFGQEQPRIPSRALPGSGFRVGPRDRRQDVAELGAITETDRNVELFKQIGLHEEFEAEVEAQNDSLGFDHIIEPVFDFLSVGNYAIAGGVEEYLLTNSPIAGLQQAGEEFLNAIGFDQEAARRTTWSDVLSGRRGETALTIDKDSPFATAAAGFVLDVLLDPTTWFGFGFGKIAVGIGKLDEVAGGLTGARRVSDIVANTSPAKTFRRLFMPHSLLKGLKEGYQADEIAEVVNRFSREQGTKPITAKDVQEGTVDFMAQIIRKDAAVSMQTEALRENILKVAAEMNEGELRLVGAYIDQPKVIEGLIKELKVDDATKGLLRKGVDEWRTVFKKVFDAEEEVGLLDKAQFRANYSAGMEPITELSRAIVENMFKVRFGKDAGSAMYKRATTDGIVTLTENGIMKASYAKKYPTLESRLHDLVPTETNVALMATRRGMESIKKVNTQKFYDTTLSDTRIAVPIDQVIAENLRDPTHEMLLEHGMAIWKAPVLSVRKQARQTSGAEHIYYAIPSAMKEQLDDMTKLVQGSDDTNKLLRTFRQVQGLWKAYALLSPGYHMRNLYSNMFNNYLAGVNNPKRYAEAMLLQVGDTANIGSRAVRSKLERILGGRKRSENYIFQLPDGQKLSGAEVRTLAEERGVMQAGLIYNESDLGIGAELMTNLQARTGRPKTSTIDTGLADWADRGARIAKVQASLYKAAREAGGDLSEEQAEKTAEVYDVIARAWAWKNYKTPDEWYEQRIREIKAYTVPTTGVPEAGLDFLHQKSVFGPRPGPNIGTPEFKKASEGMYAVDTSGNPLVVLHGTPNPAWTGEAGSGFRTMEEVAEVHNLYGPGVYTTEDFLNVLPKTQRFARVTGGYAGVKEPGEAFTKIGKAEETLSTDKTIAWLSADEKQTMLTGLQQEGESLILKAKRTRDPSTLSQMGVEERKLALDALDWAPARADNTAVSGLIGREGSVLDIAAESADFAKKLGSKRFISIEEMRRTGLEDKLQAIRKKQLAMLEIDVQLDLIERANLTSDIGGILPLYNFIKNPWVISRRSEDGLTKIREEIGEDEALSIVYAMEKVIAERFSHQVDEVQVKLAVGNPDLLVDDLIDAMEIRNLKYGTSAGLDKEEFYYRLIEDIDNTLRDDVFDVADSMRSIPDASALIFNEALQKAGFDGISHASIHPRPVYHQVYIAFDPADVKSIYNSGSWNLSVNDLLAQHGDDGLYGAIRFLDDGRADILATDGANPSTFIHEMAHLIRRTMLDEGDKDIIHRWILGETDYNKLRPQMIGQAEEAARMAPRADIDIDEMATQLMERFVWNVEGEEKFARSFEQFFLEGIPDKNAGKAMQGTFDYMREMMDTVYDFSNGGRVGLTPNTETNYLFQNILGRGVETEGETRALATAILETATSAEESFFSKAYGMLGDNMVTRANRNFGQQMENNSRLAHFITMLTTDKGKIKGNGLLNKKAIGEGMSADEAAASVKRFLFDYGELTPFERDYMKTVIPFYTWMRKNVPLQFQMIAQQPERYSAVPKLQHALESMSTEWENIPTPDYFDDINAVRMPVMSEALPLDDSGMPLYFAPDLPYLDLNRLNMKDMVSSMSPFLKMWAEIYPKKGYSFFLDSEIQEYQDQAGVEKIFGESVEMPFNEKTWHAVKTLLPPLGKVARIAKKGSEGRITEQLIREVMGLNFRSVDVDAVVRAKRFQRREVARAIRQRLIDKAKLMGFEDALEEMQDDDWF